MSDSNVVTFPKKEEPKDDGDMLVWVCKCSCTSFFCLADGRIKCCACYSFQESDEGLWSKGLPEPPPDPQSTPDSNVKTVTDLNDPIYAMKRVLGSADVEETACVVVVQKNGHIRTWGKENLNSPEQRSWIKRMFEAVLELFEVDKDGA